MKCERYREAVSARLDGEPVQLPLSALERHLISCPNCASWQQSASAIRPGFRITGDVPPDLTGAILQDTVLPVRKVQRYQRGLRTALGLLGLLQWALALPAILGDAVGMPMAMHASHESAAWNLALGAAFVAVAVKPIRAIGALPILATFVLVLGLLSIGDIANGVVAPARLASHIGIVIGTVLLALLSRSERIRPNGTSSSADHNQPTSSLTHSRETDRGTRGAA